MNVTWGRVVYTDKTCVGVLGTILYERLKLHSRKSINKREQTSSLLTLIEHKMQLTIKIY